MCRAYERLKDLALGISGRATMRNHEPVEAAKIFFIECYNLKDYLKKDSRITNREMWRNG